MRVLVTGANGLVGANLVRELLRDGDEVRAFVRPSSDRRALSGLAVETVCGDVLDPDSLASAAQGCEILYHTAAVYAYWGHPADEMTAVAVEGARNAVRAAGRSGARRVVLTSSSVVLGSSTTTVPRDERSQADEPDPPPYFRAKILQEQTAREAAAETGVELVTVCPAVTLGAHDYRLTPSHGVIVGYLNDPFKSTYPGGCNLVGARDVARGHILAARRGGPGERYFLGSENWEWSLVHRTISELCGIPGPLCLSNRTMCYLAAAAAELAARLTGRPPATTRDEAKAVGRFFWYRGEKAATLGYAPRPARAALASTIAWLWDSPHFTPWLRARLRLADEVRAARDEFGSAAG
jgi:dihydroflavonol-4-reductase